MSLEEVMTSINQAKQTEFKQLKKSDKLIFYMDACNTRIIKLPKGMLMDSSNRELMIHFFEKAKVSKKARICEKCDFPILTDRKIDEETDHFRTIGFTCVKCGFRNHVIQVKFPKGDE